MLMNKMTLQNEKGMTLVEILASITILSIILVTIIGFFTQAARYTARNEKKTVAISVAQGTMNYIQQESFDKINTYFSNTSSPATFAIQILDDGTVIPNAILDSPTTAKSILKDTSVNDVSFKDKIEIIVVNTAKVANEDSLNPLQSTTHLSSDNFQRLKEKIMKKAGGLSGNQYLYHTYVVVTWDDSSPPIILEGTVKHESLR